MHLYVCTAATASSSAQIIATPQALQGIIVEFYQYVKDKIKKEMRIQITKQESQECFHFEEEIVEHICKKNSEGQTSYVGYFLLLVVSTVVLCGNVASNRMCHDTSRCHYSVHYLYHEAVYMGETMYFHALDMFLEFEKHYSQDSTFFTSAIKRCHTANIYAPAEKNEAELIQQEDLINMVVRYLVSWKDPLMHLALEVHQLPKLYYFFSVKIRIISSKLQQLEKLTRKIAIHYDFEVPDKVVYSLWLRKKLLQSPEEETRLITIYNMLRCFSSDVGKIDFLLSFLKCQAAGEDTC